jgi:cyclopropane fatty-acyl-phospholipid synthase-like methyltransferase
MDTYRERIYRYYVAAMEKNCTITRDSLRSREPYLRRLIRHHFPPDRKARILDLGCGHGTLLHFCRLEGYDRVSGVDRSPQQAAKARELGIEGVQEGDLMTTLTALPDASQDVVIAFDVIEHFSKEELLPLIDEVRRVLSCGGRWLIHVPNGESPFQGRIRYGDFTHENIFTRNSLAQVLLASGFSEVRSFEDTPVVHGLKSLLRRVLWAGIRAGLLVYLAAETGAFDRGTILTQNFLAVATR